LEARAESKPRIEVIERSEYSRCVREHYGRADLREALTAALKHDLKGVRALTRDDVRALDEFHIRGKKATQELAEMIGLREDMKVLDFACGIGGPARTLAAEFGCYVTGVDSVEEYCEAAVFLTQQLDLSEKVKFHCADVSALPCDDGAFDVVWSQHVLMNIEDKARLLREIRRVLHPNGVLAFLEICSGSVEPPYFPVPWASDPSIHFPMSSEAMRAALLETFYEEEWRDVSSASLDWYSKTVERSSSHHAAKHPALGLHLLMGPATRQKMANVVRNLEEDRIRVIQGFMTVKWTYGRANEEPMRTERERQMTWADLSSQLFCWNKVGPSRQ
jgi:ubiquinone/menaquinone biosynthesis C-methylase UbiE